MITVPALARSLGSLALVASMVGVCPAAAASAAKQEPQVYFVAALNSQVEVVLDGESLGQVAAKSVLGPMAVAAGRHAVEFRAGSWAATATIQLDRPSVDVVVHRPADAGDDPKITVFPNEVRPIAADRARLTVAHTAVVPPADIRVAGKVLFANVANGEFVTAEVPADTYSVDIVPTGESTPLFGPLDLEVTAGALNRVFAVGRPEDGSMDAVVQVIALRTTRGSPPTSVQAGSAGLVATPTGTPSDGDAARASYLLLAFLATVAALGLVGRSAGRVRRRDDHAR